MTQSREKCFGSSFFYRLHQMKQKKKKIPLTRKDFIDGTDVRHRSTKKKKEAHQSCSIMRMRVFSNTNTFGGSLSFLLARDSCLYLRTILLALGLSF